MAAQRGGARAAAPARSTRRAEVPLAPTTTRSGVSLGRVRFRVTLVLILALTIGGLGATEGAVLLQQAVRTPTADDIAQRICTAYLDQNYDLLASQIDPATIPPNVTTPWDARAQAALVVQLRTQDDALGKVTKCTYVALAFSTGRQSATPRQYLFTMQRATLYSTGMNLEKQGNGSWLIARDSDFLGVPVGG